VEPWSGDRTDRVSGRETSGPRVALVPVAPPASSKDTGENRTEGDGDGKIQASASTADTRRVDSGRTTLMGVPSPMADREKPTTPGHDVHLPLEKSRQAGARPVAASGVIPDVELDPSSTHRIGKLEHPGSSSAGAAPQVSPTAPGQERRDNKENNDSKAGGVVPNERSMAAAAATFRASARSAEKPAPAAQEAERETDRGGWTADRTQEFHLDTAPPASPAFTKTLSIGMALAVGMGLLVQSFIHSRVRNTAPESADSTRIVSPPALPLPPLPENPIPPPAVEPPSAAPEPAAALAQPEPAPLPEATPQPAQAADEVPDTTDEALKADRRQAARAKPLAPAGRPAPSARTPRAATPVSRPGVSPEPEVAPAPVAAAPAPAATPAPTTPPPLNAPTPEKPARSPAPRSDPGTKPYDPDMPLPPTME